MGGGICQPRSYGRCIWFPKMEEKKVQCSETRKERAAREGRRPFPSRKRYFWLTLTIFFFFTSQDEGSFPFAPFHNHFDVDTPSILLHSRTISTKHSRANFKGPQNVFKYVLRDREKFSDSSALKKYHISANRASYVQIFKSWLGGDCFYIFFPIQICDQNRVFGSLPY